MEVLEENEDLHEKILKDLYEKSIIYFDFQNTPDGYAPDEWACMRYCSELMCKSIGEGNIQQKQLKDGKSFEIKKRFIGKKYPKGWYVYSFVDKNNNTLYIGKTDKLRHRINEHLRGRSNTGDKLLQEVDQIYYLSFDSQCDQEIYEIYLISYYQPKYNKISKGKIGKIALDIPLEWYRFDIESIPAIQERGEI